MSDSICWDLEHDEKAIAFVACMYLCQKNDHLSETIVTRCYDSLGPMKLRLEVCHKKWPFRGPNPGILDAPNSRNLDRPPKFAPESQNSGQTPKIWLPNPRI